MELQEIRVEGYERVAKAIDPASGLVAFIAVHDTTLGPAIGGIRMWPYQDDASAIMDVKRLAEGMTYKSAVAETGLGGGKSVIVGDSRTQKSEALFRAMGRFVNAFQGKYLPAEDVGTDVEDLVQVSRETKWVSGLPREMKGSGNPSPFTALGCVLGLEACLEVVDGKADWKHLSVAVQGLGNVGRDIVRRLLEKGVQVTVADVQKDRVAATQKLGNVKVADPSEIHTVKADVFAPCALGAILNDKSIPELQCRIVAGAANNQLAEARHGDSLRKRKITYVPDFVLNAGGIINVSVEFRPGGYDEAAATQKVQNIHRAVKEVLKISKERDLSTSAAAVELAKDRLKRGRRI